MKETNDVVPDKEAKWMNDSWLDKACIEEHRFIMEWQ